MRLRRIEEIQKMIGEYFHSRANLKVKELEIFDSIEKDEKNNKQTWVSNQEYQEVAVLFLNNKEK